MPTSFIALLDDISSTLENVTSMTKVTTKTTLTVISDDIAVSAGQVEGAFPPHKEIDVVFKIAKASLKNKALLVPLALLISSYAAFTIPFILIICGTYLCYEGAKNIYNSQNKENKTEPQIEQLNAASSELGRIKKSIRLDMLLSIEIMALALSTVAGYPIIDQAITLTIIALMIVFIVYGTVLFLLRLDDAGISLLKDKRPAPLAKAKRRIGKFLLNLAPKLMRAIAIIGTTALLLVGGGIFTHNIEALANGLKEVQIIKESLVIATIADILAGLIAGTIVLFVKQVITNLRDLYRN